MVIGRLTGYLALGLVGAFLLNALIRPASAIGTGAALTETGQESLLSVSGNRGIVKVYWFRFSKSCSIPYSH